MTKHLKTDMIQSHETKIWRHHEYSPAATHCERFDLTFHKYCYDYHDVIMTAIASQITSLTIVYSIVYSDEDQRKHQSSASLAFVRGIHRGPVNSLHKWPVTRKIFPFDDIIMYKESVWCNDLMTRRGWVLKLGKWPYHTYVLLRCVSAEINRSKYFINRIIPQIWQYFIQWKNIRLYRACMWEELWH